MKSIIIDFTNLPLAEERHYDGASFKYAVHYKDEYYLVKTNSHKNGLNMFSEYIGSKIFHSVGIPTQEVMLVKIDNEIAVACKDFRPLTSSLYSFQERMISVKSNNKNFSLEKTLDTIRIQKFLPTKIVEKRFWDMFVVDTLIGNPDRHNGNWGFLYDPLKKEFMLAPVYDCGASLAPYLTEEMIIKIMVNKEQLKNIAYNQPPASLTYQNKTIIPNVFYKTYENNLLEESVLDIVPKINLKQINRIIDDTPAITENRKYFLKQLISLKKSLVLEPALNRAIKIKKEIPFTISKPTGKGLER
ncbi:MAG: HipA domain-containing protein [Negativicoccus succinicivorans]|uniref:HipA domain-containing protein n=1 Tax=Negativicoccus succinicivorans TaxID=620903 RepID=UPI0023526D28|nr:HipA domain-containing protein [Negativicoccus succinicivorans]MBS5890739.1 HipA domain-containing protein [Negativicoccus succinicivorans]